MSHPNQAILRSAIFETIHNQLRDNDPPESKETLDRLIAQGYAEQEAMNLIGCVVTSELFEGLKNQRPFNRKRFVKALQRLPQLPWD